MDMVTGSMWKGGVVGGQYVGLGIRKELNLVHVM